MRRTWALFVSAATVMTLAANTAVSQPVLHPEARHPIAPFDPAGADDLPTTGPASRPVGPLRPQVGRPIAPVGPVGPGGRAGRATESQTADVILVGKLTDLKRGPVGMSYPPMYSTTLTFEVKEVLRGDLDKAAPAVVSHIARQEQEPQFEQGSDHIVFAKSDARQGLRIVDLKPSDEAALKAARLAASLPVGWTTEGGKVLSPWAALDAAWPPGAKAPEGTATCGKSGRPAYLAGKGVKLEVQPVPPAKEVRFSNPDGDGEYTITLTNTTDKAVDVPALLSDANGIRWDQSLLVVCQGRAQPVLAASPLKDAPKPTRIEPGRSVSTTVNAFRLTGVQWPRGGYRIEFTFALGELAASHSFYYMSRHHDPIRSRVLKDAGIVDKPAPSPASSPALPTAPGGQRLPRPEVRGGPEPFDN